MTMYYGRLFLQSMGEELSAVIKFLDQNKIPYKKKKDGTATLLGIAKHYKPKLPKDEETGERYLPIEKENGYSIYRVKELEDTNGENG